MDDKTKAVILAVLIIGVAAVGPVLMDEAAKAAKEEKYIKEFDKLKDSNSYVFRNGSSLDYRIQKFNADFLYYIRVYSEAHGRVLTEWNVTPPASEDGKNVKGMVPFAYPSGHERVYVNLQRWIPEGKEIELCEKYRYTSSWGQPGCCDIGKNLDIIIIGPSSKIEETDAYTLQLRHWTRAGTDRIDGPAGRRQSTRIR